MKKFMKLIVLGLVLSLSLFSVGCSEIKEIVAKTEVFTDEDQTIEVTAPKSYETYEEEGFILSVGDDAQERYIDISMEYKVDFADEITFEEYAESTFTYWEEEYALEILSQEKITVGGYDAISVINTFDSEGINKKAVTYLIETDDAFYVLDAHSKFSNFDDSKEELISILDSFVVK